MDTVSVIGQSSFDPEICHIAESVGELMAKKGYAVITGGLSGVMEYALKGAKKHNGLTIGIIPTYNKKDANPFCDIVIPTGLNHARNILVVSSGDIVISVGGEYGTASEIAIALKLGKKVFSYKSPLVHENNFLNKSDFLYEISRL
ncbi:TIGR00725 family protein [Deferribacter thermophilus]|uniref:TIGR00725 family protein n=1 Tax=Deferribacter thermophilus TaxID=53573 RepID=UPI003C1C038D